MQQPAQSFRFGDFSLDTGARQLLHGSTRVDLQPKAYDVLVHLLNNPDRVVTKSELLDNVWAGTVVTENVLSRVVSMLRKALNDDARSPRYIGLVPRVGYRFLEKVSRPSAAPPGRENRKALAVLPFSPLVEDNMDPVLESGMAGELIGRLSRLAGIVVRPLTMVQQLAVKGTDPLEAARMLGVDAVLHGSVLLRDNHLRVTATLIGVESDEVLWSQSFDKSSSDVFAVQDRIGDEIVQALAPRLRSTLVHAAQTSPRAYRAYLEGRLYQHRFTQPDIERAVARFEEALDQDPTYAPAWVGLAECHDFFGTTGVDPAHSYEVAARCGRRALALDPDNPDALVITGKVAWQFDWDWDRAETVLRQATERYPNHSESLIAYSDFSCYLADPEAGVEYARRALDVDPISPWVNTLLAQALHMAGRDDEAIEQATHTLALVPGFPFAHFFRGLAFATQRRMDEALADIQVAVASGRPDFPAAHAVYLAMAGREDEARQILAQIEAAGDAAPPIARALPYQALGELDKAAEAFADCIRKKDWHILLLNAEPLLIQLAEGTPSMDVLRDFMASENRA